MIEVNHERSELSESLEKRVEGLKSLADVDAEALKVIEQQNAAIRLDLAHRHTHVRELGPGVVVGTESTTYAPLMTMDGAEVANVYRRRANGE